MLLCGQGRDRTSNRQNLKTNKQTNKTKLKIDKIIYRGNSNSQLPQEKETKFVIVKRPFKMKTD